MLGRNAREMCGAWRGADEPEDADVPMTILSEKLGRRLVGTILIGSLLALTGIGAYLAARAAGEYDVWLGLVLLGVGCSLGLFAAWKTYRADSAPPARRIPLSVGVVLAGACVQGPAYATAIGIGALTAMLASGVIWMAKRLRTLE
jgi:hypothetical protein